MEANFVYQNRDGVVRTMHVKTNDQFTVHTAVDMEEVVEGIKRDRELLDPKSTNKLLARAPMTVYEKSIHEQWGDDDWKEWLNDPDNSAFRVWEGRV